MTTPLLVDIVTYAHILSAMAWLGGALLFLLVIGPVLPRLSAIGRRDVIVSVLPRLTRYMTIAGGLTILFGFALAGVVVYQGMDSFDPGQTWGLAITIGAILALVAALEGGLIVGRNVAKLVKLSGGTPSEAGSDPPADAAPLVRRIQQSAVVTVALLLTALGAMVVAAGA